MLSAIEPFVKGTSLQTALTTLQTGLNAYSAALLAAPVGGAVSVVSAGTAATALTAALVTFATQVAASLSLTIKGE